MISGTAKGASLQAVIKKLEVHRTSGNRVSRIVEFSTKHSRNVITEGRFEGAC